MAAGFRKQQDGTPESAPPVSHARLVIGELSLPGAAANDNPLPFSLKLLRLGLLAAGFLGAAGLIALMSV